MNVDKECSVLSTVTSAQPWYGDDSPHLPPWIWNQTHHIGVRQLVLATHTDQNSTHGRGPGRTTCYGADLRLRECAFPKHLEHRCCCSCNLCIKQVAHTSQLDGCTSDSNNNNNKQTVRRLTGVFGSLFWLLMTPKLDL